MNEPIHELESYFAGDCTAEQLRTIEAWINADPANASAFMQHLHFRELVGEQVRSQRIDTGNLIAELARLEAAAHPGLVEIEDQRFAHSQRTLPWVLGITGVAAAIALAITLTIVLSSPSSNTPAPFASNQPAPRGFDPTENLSPASPVATITATHNAVWASQPAGDLRRGDALYPNQRLTLTQGFAEITTNDGAIALLEAPTTIELLDNDNALRLYTGKLVGICETESSNGFVVHTDVADVVDLGTEFGVTLDATGLTATVFTGKVELKTRDRITQPILANQTARLHADVDTQEAVIEDRLAEGYTRWLPRPALVRSATTNDPRFSVKVMHQGLREDAKLFVDRAHEINGLDEQGIPRELLGGDLIRIPADARPNFNENTERFEIALELAAPALLYLIFGEHQDPLPAWIAADYEPTTLKAGIDYGPLPYDQQASVGVGPGVSIDKPLRIWKRKQIETGRVIAGRHLDDHFSYSLVAVPKPQSE